MTSTSQSDRCIVLPQEHRPAPPGTRRGQQVTLLDTQGGTLGEGGGVPLALDKIWVVLRPMVDDEAEIGPGCGHLVEAINATSVDDRLPSRSNGETILGLDIDRHPIGARELAWLRPDIPVEHLVTGREVARDDMHGTLRRPPVDIEGRRELDAIIGGTLVDRWIRNVGCLDRAVKEIRLPRNRHPFGQIAGLSAVAVLRIAGQREAMVVVKSRQFSVAALPVCDSDGEWRRVQLRAADNPGRLDPRREGASD